MKLKDIDWNDVISTLVFSFLYVLFTYWLCYFVITGILLHPVSIILKACSVIICAGVVCAVWEFLKIDLLRVLRKLKCVIF